LICQIGIMVFSLSAAFLMAFKNRWGVICGCCSQSFWFITSYINGQEGIFIVSFAYSVSWIIGIYKWWIEPNLKERKV